MVLHRLSILLLLLVLVAADPVGAGVVLIANPDNGEFVLDQSDVERIYLGKLTHWEDDSAIIPVMLKDGETHKAFLDEYLNRTVHRFVGYWRQMVFTGKGIPPKSFAEPAELAAYVAATPGSIGYVSDSTALAGVNIVAIR
jgi:ABC-type phosphate transport system substrate-binding protein